MRKRAGTLRWLCEPAGGFSKPDSGLKKILHWETRVFLLPSWSIGKKGFSLHVSTAFWGILEVFFIVPLRLFKFLLSHSENSSIRSFVAVAGHQAP